MPSFRKFQQSGAKRVEWLSNPGARCPITASRLTLHDLQHTGWSISREQIYLPDEYHSRVSRVRIPLNAQFYRTGVVRTDVYAEWEGVIGPGMVIIETIFRTGNTNLPFSSELTKAAYQEYYRLEELKYVFVENVVNDETMEFVRYFIYPEYRMHVYLQEAPRKSFRYGTAEYQALLGTRIGKVVIYFLLNSFAPGTRHIGKIATLFVGYTLQFRFDIDRSR
ncbi:hypothetical protein N7486_006733 [Penicillium sp. IBT 16267x]|nr:hypothetical protein N7486_006733 [Penicillium sp. IBT 16267x]